MTTEPSTAAIATACCTPTPVNTPFAGRAGCAAHDGMHLVGDCALTAPKEADRG